MITEYVVIRRSDNEIIKHRYAWKYYFEEGTIFYLNENNYLDNIDDLPAVIHPGGEKIWFRDGYYFRENDLPVRVGPDGKQEWFDKQNMYHRGNDLPAVIHPDVSQEWWFNGKRHRIGKPAVIRSNGFQQWWVNNRLHREDGPAQIFPGEDKNWYYKGCQVDGGWFIPQKLQWAMIEDDPENIKKIHNATNSIKWKIIKDWPQYIGTIDKYNKEMQEYICINRPDLISKIRNLDSDLRKRFEHELSIAGIEI